MTATLTAKGISAGYSQGEVGWGDGLNADLVRLSAWSMEQWAADPVACVGLTFAFKGGIARAADGTLLLFPDGTMPVPGNASVVYIERTTQGALSANLVGWTPDRVPLAVLSTNATNILSILDRRLPGQTTANGTLGVSSLAVTGAISGNTLTVASGGTVGGNLSVGAYSTGMNGLGVGNDGAVGTTPFIDFHYGVGYGAAYNVRVINNAPNSLNVLGISGSVAVSIGGSIALTGLLSSSVGVNGNFIAAQFLNTISGLTTGLYFGVNTDTGAATIAASGSGNRALILQTGNTPAFKLLPDTSIVVGTDPGGLELLRVGGQVSVTDLHASGALTVAGGSLRLIDAGLGQWGLFGGNNLEGFYYGSDNLWSAGRVADAWAVSRGGVLQFRVYSDGRIDCRAGITSNGTLTVNGPTQLNGNLNGTGSITVTGTITAGGDIMAFSDRKLKTLIEPLEDALSKIRRLQGVRFEMKDKPGVKQIGFIAQDVQAVVPEVVREIGFRDEPMLTVAYGNITALLVEAIKELYARLEHVAR